MRILGNLAMILAALAPSFGHGGEDLEFKRLCEHPLDRVYKVRDDHGRRLSLFQWKVSGRIYFVLKDTASGEVIEKATADSAVTVPPIFRDEEIQLMVQPETKAKDGKVTPAVYKKSSRKVAMQSEFTNYLKDGKVVVSVPNSALPGVLPDVTIGNLIYLGGHERAGGSLENLKDSDPNTAFKLDFVVKKSADEYTVFDSVGRNFAFYVWEIENKWYFMLVDGHTVKKKIVAADRITVPGIYEERVRQNCVKGENVDEKGNIVPPVFVDESYRAVVKNETVWYLGAPEQIQWASNRKITIAGQTYSAIREPYEDFRGSSRPAKAKEGDF